MHPPLESRSMHLDDAAVGALALPPHVERALMENLPVLRTLRAEIASLENILHHEVRVRAKFRIP
jgi:transposase